MNTFPTDQIPEVLAFYMHQFSDGMPQQLTDAQLNSFIEDVEGNDRDEGGGIKIKHKGSLKSIGYSSKLSDKDRGKVLVKAVKEYGHGETVKKINALCVLNKNKPIGEVYRRDMMILEKMRK